MTRPSVDFSCLDWKDRLRDGRSLVPASVLSALDPGAAARAVVCFDKLRLPDVEDTPTLGEAAADWFRDIVRAVLGSGGRGAPRIVTDTFVLVPKKNSKTTNSAALMVTALLLNTRPAARFGLFGPTQEIADLAFAGACNSHGTLAVACQSDITYFKPVQTGRLTAVAERPARDAGMEPPPGNRVLTDAPVAPEPDTGDGKRRYQVSSEDLKEAIHW